MGVDNTKAQWGVFEQRMHELRDLEAVLHLLGWDEQVLIPSEGRARRAEQNATMASLYHERVVDPAYGEAIEALWTERDALEPTRAAMVREARRDRERSVRVPAELVRELAETGSLANRAWEEARKASDFQLFRPHLERLVQLKQQEADAIGHDGERYDALLDAYEPDMRVAQLQPLLNGLRDELVPFLRTLVERPQPDAAFLKTGYDKDLQRQLTERVLRDFGFDFDGGRQDVSTHPFCSGTGPGDVRMTTRYYDSLEPGALLSSMHECGHGLYEQGIPVELARTFVGGAPSLGLHESQSRFWENIVGRSRPFWQRYLPIAREYFPEQLAGVGFDDFLRSVNQVKRSAIRVDADEVTYNLHILVRFELELALMRGELAVADLPGAWRERYETYLGYTPKNDVEGVMQDIHWSWGEIGYFPTYTLGNLYSAELAEAMRRDLDVDAHVAAGEFAPILGWLRTKIHSRGRIVSGAELILEVTGKGLSHDAYMRYLRGKYGPLYGI